MANTTNTQQVITTAQNTRQAPTIGSTFTAILSAANSGIRAVDNTMMTLENVTGAMADKSAQYREQSKIAGAITHNRLMNQLNKEAEQMGLTF